MVRARFGKTDKVLIVFDTLMDRGWEHDGIVSQKGILPFLKKFMEAGLSFDDVSAVPLADVYEKPKASDYKYKAPYIQEIIETRGYNVIIPIGAAAFEKVVGIKGAAKYFGKTLYSEKYPDQKVLPCPSPAQAKHDPGVYNIIAQVVKKAVIEKEYPDIREAAKLETHYSIIDTMPKFQAFLAAFLKPEVSVFAYDLETTGLYFNIDEITTIQFSHKPGYSYLIPCNTIGTYPAAPCPWTAAEWVIVVAGITAIFAVKERLHIVGHNKKFDDKFIYHHWGIPLQKSKSWDTMIASFLCDENTPNGLKELTCQYTDMGDYELPLEKFKDEYCKKNKLLKQASKKTPDKPCFSYSMIPFEILAPYALCDTDATIRLYYFYMEELKKEEQERTFALVMRITWLLTRFELNGWPVNVAYAKKLQAKLEKDIEALGIELMQSKYIEAAEKILTATKLAKANEKKHSTLKTKIAELKLELKGLPTPSEDLPKDILKTLTKQRDAIQKRIDTANSGLYVGVAAPEQVKFNLGSPVQKRVLFFDVMRLPVVKRTKKGKGDPATDKESVSTWMRTQPKHKEFLQNLQHYSEMCKFLSTYVLGILNKTVNGRVHPTYNACGAKTGRTSSRDPNFQNLPARGDERKMKLVKAIKAIVEAPEGTVLLGADLSAIEMRWACIVSGDKKLEQIFLDLLDIHGSIAKELFDYIQCHPNEVKKLYEFERNSVSKTVQFLSVYGGGASTLAKKVNESIIERQEMAKAKGVTLNLVEYTDADGQAILDDYFRKYQGVDQYIKDTTKFVIEHGYALSVYGYKRRVPAINSADEGVRMAAIRQAVNATIQNPASVSLLLALCNLQEEIDDLVEQGLMAADDFLLMGSVHDAGYQQVKTEILIDARDRLLKHLTAPPIENCPIPMLADAEWGSSWATFSEDFGSALVDVDEDEDEEEEIEEAEVAGV